MSTLFKRSPGFKGYWDQYLWTLQAYKQSIPHGLRDYTDIIEPAANYKLKTSNARVLNGNDKEHVVFIDKPIKSFNLKEVQSLVNIDTKYSNVKFKLITDNAQIEDFSIDSDFKRLFNNVFLNEVYQNNHFQTEKVLESLDGLEEKIDQVVLSEQIFPDGRTKYKPIFQSPEFKIPLKINGESYKLITPSIPILARIEYIGVPETHPDVDNLVNEEVSNPLGNGYNLRLIKVPSSLSNSSGDLVAIIPKHILNHQEYSRSKPSGFGLISFDGEKYNLTELTEIICQKLNLPVPIIITAPFIISSKFANEKKLTKTVNGHELLDPKYFDKVSYVENAKSTAWRLRHESTYLHVVPPEYIQDCINLQKSSERKERSQNPIDVTPDTLRSVILDNNKTSNRVLFDRYNSLDVLTHTLEAYDELYSRRGRLDYYPKLSEILEKYQNEVIPVDYTIVRKFYELFDNRNYGVGNYIILLADYILYNESYKQFTGKDRTNILKILLSNILVRFLKDHIRYHFPEFSRYYLHQLGLDQLNTTSKVEDGSAINKWTNYITYQIEDITDHQVFDIHPELVSKIHAWPKLPIPYSSKLNLNSADRSVLNDLEFLNFVSIQSTGSKLLVNPNNINSFFTSKCYYHQDTTVLKAYRDVADVTIEDIIKRVKPWGHIDYLIETPKSLSIFQSRLINILKHDINYVTRSHLGADEDISHARKWVVFYVKRAVDETYWNEFKVKYDEITEFEPIIEEWKQTNDFKPIY